MMKDKIGNAKNTLYQESMNFLGQSISLNSVRSRTVESHLAETETTRAVTRNFDSLSY